MPIVDVERILCPVDFSDASRGALTHAVSVARWFNASLTVLHVDQPFTPAILTPTDPTGMLPARPSRDELLREVGTFVAQVSTGRVPISVEVETGAATACILGAAERLDADLIVIGTHGRSGLDRIVIGSVAATVLHKAACPVLVVPPEAAGPPAVTFQRIICAVDFGPSSMRALDYALSMAQEAGGALTVLHVLEPIPEDVIVAPPFDPAAHRHAREDEAMARFRAAVPPDARLWCELTELVGSGRPYSEILRVAAERNCDLIVMGTVGRGVLDRLFFGSTANHVVGRAPCPVLTVRASAAGTNGQRGSHRA